MEAFRYHDGLLCAESVPLDRIAAEHGTPCYVYSRATLERHYRVYREALGELDGLVCFAVKANSNLAVLNVLARLGSGFDIVSGGELQRVLAAGDGPLRQAMLEELWGVTHSNETRTLDNHVARLFTDVEATYTYEGTNEINLLIAGREITGLGAFV